MFRGREKQQRTALIAQIARIPIRWRLALISFGLLALLLAALGVFISLTEEHTLLVNQAVALRNDAQLVFNASKGRGALPGPGHGFPPGGNGPQSAIFAANLVQHLAGANIRATVFTPNGSVVAASDNGEPLIPPVVTLAPSLIQQALTEQPQNDSYILATDVTGQRQLVVLVPLTVGPQQQEIVQLSTPTTSIDNAVTTTRLILIFGILGALGIAGALTLPLIGAALRPLVTMERASQRIASGALSLRLEEPPTQDEIGRLARSFNSMVAQLEATFSRQKQFVADVSHELRTPLTALGGGMEMLLLGADNGDVEASRHLLRGMYSEVGRMQRLVEDLLTLTKLDEGRIRLRDDVIMVSALLNDVCEQAQRLAQGQTIQCETASNVPTIHGDTDRLKQVLLDILDNALKYTPPSGRITLMARMDDPEHISMTVQDSGSGIEPEALPHVFDRFYRADPSRTRSVQQTGGSGLGLAIAKGLIEAHRGTITLASEPGQGTTVTIRLPLAL